ncbi:AfsR/SARP family transcriptional regulator [Solihabitans fulvus]|uniref:AfsR/SARP family transcriptional regulator n=1 Tax=Solihabitans fulvus TaxID=1892852 RepID=UPI001661CC47|nr:BTAD domain-containing putative transcriptional regulator [Solihabitans fulvus]
MEFRLLGAVEAHTGAGVVNLGPRQQRLVLAVLALEVNRLVPVDRLVALVWPVSPPRTAEHAIRVCISRLRAILAGADGRVELVTQGSGYLLRADPASIDVHRFRALVDQAREAATDEDRLALLDRAVGLWSGPALAGAASAQIREQLCHGLDEARLVAVEDRLDARLRLGQHRDTLDELTALVDTHPTRERLVGQLMLARYRSGQASAALDLSRQTRQHLGEELGIDPGAELRDLELAILRNDPVLDWPAAAPQEQADNGHRSPPPAQLPPAVPDFVGRTELLWQLDELVARPEDTSAVVITAIAGTAGVGKTALAVRWAHHVRDRFPDGQLYLNLRGYTKAPPLAPLPALAQLLRALGVAADQVPIDVDEAAGLYRTLLADKRVLVVLDNVANPNQVRPLLPASPGCLVVITSRDRLAGLVAREGARRITVDVLAPEESRALLTGILGARRVADEPSAVAELAGRCAHLPIALRITAANLTNDPHRRIADYLAELDASNLLSAMEIDGDEDAAVRATFDLSYTALRPEAQRLFRLLGLVPGADFTPQAAAALADGTQGQARTLLDQLAGAHLIDAHGPGRYAFHDLLRRYARDRADDTDSADDRAEAVGRLADFYLRHTDAAARLLYPEKVRLPIPGAAGTAFRDHREAVAWLDAERGNLIAAVTDAAGDGRRESAWLLGNALRGYLELRRYNVDGLAVARVALAAADTEGDLRARTALRLDLGRAHAFAGFLDEAAEHYTAALALSRRAEWPDGEADALARVAHTRWEDGQRDVGIACYEQALEINRRIDRTAGQANNLNNLGVLRWQLGQFAAAVECADRAMELYRQVGSPVGVGMSLLNLGEYRRELGELRLSVDHLTSALGLIRQIGDRHGEAITLCALATTYRDLGRQREAMECAEAALACETGDRPAEAETLSVLGTIHFRLGEYQRAVDRHRNALRVSVEVNWLRGKVRALLGLAECALVAGRAEDAVDHIRDVLTQLDGTGFRAFDGEARTALARAFLAQGNRDLAARHARDALLIHAQTGQLLLQAHALYVLGLAAEGTTAALSYLRDAHALFVDIGAPEARRLETLLRQHHQHT